MGHEGTDANGRVCDTSDSSQADGDVRRAQVALNAQGYAVAVDGIRGPATASVIRDFQSRNGLSPTGVLDHATRQRFGVND